MQDGRGGCQSRGSRRRYRHAIGGFGPLRLQRPHWVKLQPVAVNGEGVSTSLDRRCLWLIACPDKGTIAPPDNERVEEAFRALTNPAQSETVLVGRLVKVAISAIALMAILFGFDQLLVNLFGHGRG